MIEIYNEDCLIGMRNRIVDKSIDLIVTSPPYNIGTKYNKYSDYISRQEYFIFMLDLSSQLNRVMSDNGSLFLNISGKPSDPYIPFDVINLFRQRFILQNTFHWIKNISIEDKSYGHFKPINSKRYVNDCHEYIFHLTKTGNVELERKCVGVEYTDKTNIHRWSSNIDKRCKGNNWFIPYETIQNTAKERPHPASFPIELPRQCMMIHGIDRIKLALDPFLGIGASAIAAQQLKIDFIGFEIDIDYYEETLRRLL